MESWNFFCKNKFIARVKVHKTFFSKAKGLMFAPPLKKKEGIILVSDKEDLSAIHMLFVFYPIDVLWLDRNKRVIHKVENAQPFSLYHAPPKPAQYIVELPRESIKKIKKSDQIKIKKN